MSGSIVFLGPGPDFEFRGFATLGHRLSSFFFASQRAPRDFNPNASFKLSPRTIFSRPEREQRTLDIRDGAADLRIVNPPRKDVSSFSPSVQFEKIFSASLVLYK